MNATVLAADFLPPASLPHARALRDDLRRLLAVERAAAAHFLLALADFDHRRGREPLGYASLFAFLRQELGLSAGAAHLRFSAARLLPRFPEVEVSLRAGQLCLSAVGELAKVLTPANRAELLPRFFGCSFREARELAAALAPRADPPRREVVTALSAPSKEVAAGLPLLAPGSQEGGAVAAGSSAAARAESFVAGVRTSELAPVRPARARPLDEVEPLDAELRRLHLTVSRRLLDKVAAARDGLSHSRPGATMEQVLEAALDLLLEKQARSKALVKRPRRVGPSTPVQGMIAPLVEPAARAESRAAVRWPAPAVTRQVPAEVEREVRRRDGGRCQYPLDSGGVCGSTRLIQLDHVIPVALGGPSTVANLRLACASHNRFAARLALGEALMEANRGGSRRR